MNKNIKNLVTSPLFQMFFVGILCFLYYDSIGSWNIRFFLTISMLLREVLLFVLPFLIFSFISVALSEMKGTILIILVMILVFLSSFFHTFLAGILGYSLLNNSVNSTIEKVIEITPLIDFDFIKIADNVSSLIAGISIGILNSYLKNKYINYGIYFVRDLVINFMNKFFIKLLPIFIGGFLLKLLAEGQITNMVHINASVFAKLMLFLILYFGLWLFVSSKFNWKSSVQILKNIMPSLITAIATVSSAAAFPLSLKAAENNTNDKKLTNAIMPLTLSFHLVGDAILVLIMCMMVTTAFGHPLPNFHSFFVLATFFVFNQFAGAGVPNATIMILIPILKSSWGFDDAMIAFTIAFYSIIEPIATAGNVAANNLFVILFKNVFGRFTEDFKFKKMVSSESC